MLTKSSNTRAILAILFLLVLGSFSRIDVTLANTLAAGQSLKSLNNTQEKIQQHRIINPVDNSVVEARPLEDLSHEMGNGQISWYQQAQAARVVFIDMGGLSGSENGLRAVLTKTQTATASPNPTKKVTIPLLPSATPTRIPSTPSLPGATPTHIPSTSTLTPSKTATTTSLPTMVEPSSIVSQLSQPLEAAAKLPQIILSDNAIVQRTGTWRSQSASKATGGHYLFSSGSPGDALSLSFQGSGLDVISVHQSSLGTFGIEIDGRLMKTVDSEAARSTFGVHVSIRNLSSSTHFARVYSVNGKIAIEAFAVEVQLQTTASPTPSYTPSVTAVTPVPLTGTAVPTTSSNGFLHLSGTRLMDGAGNPVKLYGATMYPSSFSGNGWASTKFPPFIDLILDMAVSAHLNTLRATDILQYGDWHNMTLWNNLDYLVQHAAQRHIWVIIDLSTFRNSVDKQGVFAYDPALWQGFITFIAQRYKNAPNVAYYEISGEPQDPKRDAQHEPTAGQLITFYKTISNLLYTNDGNHLVGTGSFGHLNARQNMNCTDMAALCIPWQQIYSLAHIDLPGVHSYSNGDLHISIPMVQQWTILHNKPFSVDEFGFQQGADDTARAAAFDNIYNTLERYSNNANIIFWNLGPQLSPTSYEVNPQTPQTWQIVQKHAPQ